MQPGDRTSGSERRRSAARRSVRLSEDDGYDLTAGAVSDGFRPSAASNGTSTTIPPPSRLDFNRSFNLPRPPPLAAAIPAKDHDEFNRPPSTAKPPRLHDSLTLRNDGSISSRDGQSSSSSSSTQVDSPYRGTIQPSHPYQMYPQRTYSNATSSTGPLNSVEAYDGSRGPTHPYALYTQNTAAPEDHSQRPIPVGFNGMGDGYHRQLGPDGEEAGDLIGPLGHMEELPPYTRYPLEAYAAKPATGTDAVTLPSSDADTNRTNAGLTVSSPVRTIPGAGGIGLATRNPEFSSTEEDLPSAPNRSGSIRSVPSIESYHAVNDAARDVAEKPTQGTWQRRAKKKLCGIVPYWAICLVLAGIIIMGVVMGTVIGTIVTRRGPPSKDKSGGQKPPLTSNIEYLKEKPVGLPPLDTGCYALPPMEKYQVPKACIKDSAQSPAWSCDMPFRWYSMNVTPIPEREDTSNYALKLAPFDPKSSKFIWGSQPPDIPDFQRLALVKDLEQKNRGPAWYLEVEYNKTVILREDQLQATPTGAAKRHWGALSSPVPGFDKSRYMRKGFAAAEGDKPWICTWPNIKLQVFIYPNQTFTPTKTTASAGPTSTGSSEGPSPSNYKEPYTKLVKFVERRPDNAAAATCTQYKIIDGGRDKQPVCDENDKPITVTINEVVRGSKGTVTDRLTRSNSWDELSPLHKRDVDLTPCGCVSFSWSV